MMRSVTTVHAVFLIAVALIMSGFALAAFYAFWAFELLHTLTHHM